MIATDSIERADLMTGIYGERSRVAALKQVADVTHRPLVATRLAAAISELTDAIAEMEKEPKAA
jgi:hypothetical protein